MFDPVNSILEPKLGGEIRNEQNRIGSFALPRQHPRRDQEDEFFVVIGDHTTSKQVTEQRNIAEERNLRLRLCLRLHGDAAEDQGASVGD